MTGLPLAGLKVADFSWVVAGPLVGRSLADFGATVVRVESSTRIETARMMQPFYDGTPGERLRLPGGASATLHAPYARARVEMHFPSERQHQLRMERCTWIEWHRVFGATNGSV